MANRTIRTPRKRAAILEVIAAGGTVAEAAKHAGVGRSSIFDWRAADPAFDREFKDAFDTGTDVWEAKGRSRAWEGDTSLYLSDEKPRSEAI